MVLGYKKMEKIQRIKAIIDRTLPEHIVHCVSENSMSINKYSVPYWRIKLTVDAATIEHALAISNGNFSLASDLLGISRNSMYKWVKDMEINTEDCVFDGRSPGLFKLRKKGGTYEEFRRESRRLFYEFFEEELA